MGENTRELFNNKIKWKVYNQEFKALNGYSYNSYKFKFEINDQQTIEEFTELIAGERVVMPWEICNFFLDKHIKYSINFRYIKELSLRDNWFIFKVVQEMKLNHLKIIMRSHIFFDKKIERKLINGKERTSYSLHMYLPLKNTIYFIQGDSNIWWLPKIIRHENEKSKVVSLGWLFSQIGRYTIKTESEA